MKNRLLFTVLLIAGLFCFGPSVGRVEACPMCKAATETDDHLPKAYMYSILFMLAVPATIFGGIGISLYRLNRKEAEAIDEFDQFQDEQSI